MAPAAKSGTGAYVSEALAFMWEQNIQLNIDPNNPVKKEALQASLIQNWRGSEPLGKTEAGYMATFIRPRAAKTGKNSKSGKPGV